MIITSKQMRPRERHDHYPTPSGLCRAALDLLPPRPAPQHILDPGAGTGVWGAVARERWPAATITGVEWQLSPQPPAYNRWFCAHFAAYSAMALRRGWAAPDLIVGNPPYRYAEQFVRLSLAMLAPGGCLVQLLRLAFLEGQERARGLWRDLTPISVDACARRPSFTGNGKTDATAYAIFIWQQGEHPRRYSGGFLLWADGEKLPEDSPFRPILALPALPAPVESESDLVADTVVAAPPAAVQLDLWG